MATMKKLALISTLICSAFISANTQACTDFRLTSKDGNVLVTRTLEFALDLKSNLRTSTRGRVFTNTAPDGKPGFTWKAKYGYVYLDGLNVDIAMDGMNEKGLSIEALYLPGFAGYQTVPAGQNANALPYIQTGNWILSNFATVDEVKAALSQVYIFNQAIPTLGNTVFPLHFAVYEASGKSIVIEIVNGKMNVYDNQLGLMTNSPTYNWHLTNLNNYAYLTPQNPTPVQDNGVMFASTGQGYGMIGLPGDISPSSRFIKIATLLRVVVPANNAADNLNLAQHIINNVDIPVGFAREPQNGNFTSDKTEWTVFKDLTNLVLYYRTYADTSLHSVSLSKLNFAENAPRLKMPLASTQFIQDQTDQFLKTSS
jgi:choloylglycine hydrolase